jgi:ATP-dependent Clp protease adaptor protein ClpS
MSGQDYDLDEAVVVQNEKRLEKPPLYKVLLHNDNFTTMEFVVYLLQTVFQLGDMDAITVMLEVHTKGIGVCGLYPYEIAEMKAARVMALAQANEFPLLCTIEED